MATKELLGTNRGFELNDVTQFTLAGGYTVTGTGTGTGATIAHSGTYGLNTRVSDSDVNWTEGTQTKTYTITTDPVYCAATIPVTVSFWQRIYQDTKDVDLRWGTRTMAMDLKFYTGADALISTHSISTAFPTSTWAEQTAAAVTAPTNTVYARIVITYTIPYHAVEPAESLTMNHYIAVDDFSITVPGSVPRAMIIG